MSPLHRVLIGLGSARQLVRRADRARDRKAYAKAAKFYTLALTLHPETNRPPGLAGSYDEGSGALFRC
jgi:hypothetical protein